MLHWLRATWGQGKVGGRPRGGARTGAQEVLLGVAKGVAVADADKTIDDDEEAAAILARAHHLLIPAHVQLPMPQYHLHAGLQMPPHEETTHCCSADWAQIVGTIIVPNPRRAVKSYFRRYMHSSPITKGLQLHTSGTSSPTSL